MAFQRIPLKDKSSVSLNPIHNLRKVGREIWQCFRFIYKVLVSSTEAAHQVVGIHLKALVLRAAVQQLLSEIIAEGVGHEVYEIVQDLREHLGNCLGAPLVKLALQEAAAILVLGDGKDLHLQI